MMGFWLVLEAVCVFRELTSAQSKRLLLQRIYEVWCCSSYTEGRRALKVSYCSVLRGFGSLSLLLVE